MLRRLSKEDVSIKIPGHVPMLDTRYYSFLSTLNFDTKRNLCILVAWHSFVEVEVDAKMVDGSA